MPQPLEQLAEQLLTVAEDPGPYLVVRNFLTAVIISEENMLNKGKEAENSPPFKRVLDTVHMQFDVNY